MVEKKIENEYEFASVYCYLESYNTQFEVDLK